MTTTPTPDMPHHESLAEHLANFGLNAHRSQAATERELKKQMGPERYKKYAAVCRARRSGRASVQDVYRLVETAAEWGTLFSSQTEHLRANGTWVTDQLRTLDPPPGVMIDFGCSTGVLTSWLARQFPAARVIGLDREANFVAIARKSNRWSNLSFEQYDYSVPASEGPLGAERPKAEAGIATFGIDFDTPLSPPAAACIAPNEPAPTSNRAEVSAARAAADAAPRAPIQLDLDVDESSITGDADYERYWHHAAPAFAHWRAAFAEGGTLLAVLRIPSLPTFAGVVHAAHAAGWSIELPASSKLQVWEEQFPALVFKALRSQTPSLAELAGFWHEPAIRAAFRTPLTGYPAEQLYRLLHPKTTTDRRECFFASGTVATIETGTTGPFAFARLTTDTGAFLLNLTARHHLATVGGEMVRHFEQMTGDFCAE